MRIAIHGQAVVGHERVVGERDALPAPDPFVVQRELAFGFDAAPELAIAGLARERAAIELVDAVSADLIGTILQPLTEFALQQHALPAGDARTDGRVVVGRAR